VALRSSDYGAPLRPGTDVAPAIIIYGSAMSTLARNPWVAVDVTTDPLVHGRLLQRAHERGIGGEAVTPEEIRALVAASWRRSLEAGVAPDAPGAPMRLKGDEL
jgi:hypothetical protein